MRGFSTDNVLRAAGASLVLFGTLGFLFTDVQQFYVASWLAFVAGMVLYLVGHILGGRRSKRNNGDRSIF